MKWSWRLGKFAGIEVFLHATFVLFLAWIALMRWMSGHGVAEMLSGTAFIVALFASVLLHEFGHALTAQRYGICTRNITLLPIGGIAQLERLPEDPKQELAVALAGPAVNGVIAAGLFLFLGAVGVIEPLGNIALTQGMWIERVLLANVMLMFFNLLPAFPMDGGRALRALLKFWTNHVRATQIAATVGQFFALVFGFIGLLVNPSLVLIAIFVWFGASQEASVELMKSSLAGIPVSRAMLTDFQTLRGQDPLFRAVDLMLKGSQRDLPVIDEGRVVGLLSQTDLANALTAYGPDGHVVVRRDFSTADASESLETVFIRLSQSPVHTILVTRAGRLVGLLTPDKIAGFLMLHEALGESAAVKSAKAA
jgi:Zn-dependent protease/predicted transcriptional regulator